MPVTMNIYHTARSGVAISLFHVPHVLQDYKKLSYHSSPVRSHIIGVISSHHVAMDILGSIIVVAVQEIRDVYDRLTN